MKKIDSLFEDRMSEIFVGYKAALNEKAPPGMEDLVRKLKKEYPGEIEKAYATAWSIYNKKHGKVEEALTEDGDETNEVPVMAQAVAKYLEYREKGIKSPLYAASSELGVDIRELAKEIEKTGSKTSETFVHQFVRGLKLNPEYSDMIDFHMTGNGAHVEVITARDGIYTITIERGSSK